MALYTNGLLLTADTRKELSVFMKEILQYKRNSYCRNPQTRVIYATIIGDHYELLSQAYLSEFPDLYWIETRKFVEILNKNGFQKNTLYYKRRK